MNCTRRPLLRFCGGTFLLLVLSLILQLSAHGAPVRLVEQAPVAIENVAPGVVLVDFGRVAFGNLEFQPPTNAVGEMTVRFGEDLVDGRINTNPPGSVRYARVETKLTGAKTLVVAPPPNQRNTTNLDAVLTPPAWGVLLPFRWVEIAGWPGPLKPDRVRRRAAFAAAWNEQAAAFHCSDQLLNRLWELCRYSIKATTFAGVYVDGDRERISYEADAYLSQLGDYYVNGDVQMARDTFDRLLAHPTWPTEWASHMIFMAYADWMETGNTNWLAPRYAALKGKLLAGARADGLIVSPPAKVRRGDLVDWPEGERDGFVLAPVNTVINAFNLRSLNQMAELARALRRDRDAVEYSARAQATLATFQKKLFDPRRGLYRDGEGVDHYSLHANLFPLAFGLVPPGNRTHIAQWLSERGMVCSVYAAQYLIEGLLESGCTASALGLMTAPGDRSWKHMLDSGTTITWEAWDQRYKPNQDWNHAWGAAPANLLPRYVLGAQPLTPGWRCALVQPHPGPLADAEGKVPTPLGPIEIHWENHDDFRLELHLPPGMTAQVKMPAGKDSRVLMNGKPVVAQRRGDWWHLTEPVAGTTLIAIKEAKFSRN